MTDFWRTRPIDDWLRSLTPSQDPNDIYEIEITIEPNEPVTATIYKYLRDSYGKLVQSQPYDGFQHLAKAPPIQIVLGVLNTMSMTVSEAGRKGGQTTKEKYGPEFYARIGKKGGETVSEERGPEFYAEIGKKGGETVKAKHGRNHFSRIGRMGGATVRDSHDPNYYRRIGSIGGTNHAKLNQA